jgi:hypothetical protein
VIHILESGASLAELETAKADDDDTTAITQEILQALDIDSWITFKLQSMPTTTTKTTTTTTHINLYYKPKTKLQLQMQFLYKSLPS